jgi:hypothetical protein
MNMLIAIMGDTYARMSEVIDQARLFETIQMINDHIWLIDLEKEFQDARYIFVATLKGSKNQGNPD